MPPSTRPDAAGTGVRTVAIVLAAGRGARFDDDGHKLLAELPANDEFPAETVLERCLSVAMAAGIGPVVAVTGAIDPPLPPGVVRCPNPAWADGQMSSLLAGLEAAGAMGADAAVVGLADQPGVTADAWRLVAAASGPIVVATYGGRRGNPVKLEASVWDLLPRSGDEGGRALMRLRPDLVSEVACTGSPADIDTVEDLRRWQSN